MGTWSYATTTTPYKLSARYLYPVVEPLAEPAIARARESGAVSMGCSCLQLGSLMTVVGSC